MFLSQQEQLENIDHKLHLVLEQMADLKRRRFGRPTEKHETGGQISFMEVDGKIVFLMSPKPLRMRNPGKGQKQFPAESQRKNKGNGKKTFPGFL